jgi:hypothetical protein
MRHQAAADAPAQQRAALVAKEVLLHSGPILPESGAVLPMMVYHNLFILFDSVIIHNNLASMSTYTIVSYRLVEGCDRGYWQPEGRPTVCGSHKGNELPMPRS